MTEIANYCGMLVVNGEAEVLFAFDDGSVGYVDRTTGDVCAVDYLLFDGEEFASPTVEECFKIVQANKGACGACKSDAGWYIFYPGKIKCPKGNVLDNTFYSTLEFDEDDYIQFVVPNEVLPAGMGTL